MNDLPFRAKRVVEILQKEAPKPLTLAELARKCFPGYRPTARANWTVRNQLRRLTKYGLVEKVEPGIYRIAAPETSQSPETAQSPEAPVL